MNANSDSRTVVGIDLGTTMSAICYLDEKGVVQTIPGNNGEFLTPSAILIGEDHVYIGEPAIQKATQFPNMFAECFKRNIGQSHYPVKIKDYNIPPEVLCAIAHRRTQK